MTFQVQTDTTNDHSQLVKKYKNKHKCSTNFSNMQYNIKSDPHQVKANITF